MSAFNVMFFSVLVLFGVVCCQIQYIPANVLIPTINGSLLISNYSVFNKTNGSPYVNNNTNNPPPYHFGNNYYNRTNQSTVYNGSQDGHLIVGSVQAFDRLLFSQVSRIINFNTF